MRKALSMLVFGLACGGAAAPNTTTQLPIPVTPIDAGPVVAVHKRGPSAELQKVWPFEEAETIFYADAQGLAHTRLFSELAPSLISQVSSLYRLSEPQKKCIGEVFAASKELAFGSAVHDKALLLILYDESQVPAVRDCFDGVTAMQIPGARDAWRINRDLVATANTGQLAIGLEAVVRALVADGHAAAALDAIALVPDEYVRFVIETSSVKGDGSLVVSDRHLGLHSTMTLPSESMAEILANQFAAVSSANTDPVIARLLLGTHVTHKGKRLSLAFEMRESVQEQISDIGTVAALAINTLRQYLVDAKKAEARATLYELSHAYVLFWESDNGTPLKKKKLRSFPAVPATVPRGVQITTTTRDWLAWAPIKFERTTPQYYQYEIKAAKDGESAEILARGDLNGDGKTSLFKLEIRIQRPENTIERSGPIEETDPNE